MSKDEKISFGPDFMSDDLPIFQKHTEEQEEEEYKKKLEEEKKKLSDEADAERKNKEGNQTDQGFIQLISMLASQAYVFLGAIENPSTGTRTPNPEQAKFQIESLAGLFKKTEGNLSEEEENIFKQALNELQMLYVEMSRGPSMPTAPIPSPEKNPPQ